MAGYLLGIDIGTQGTKTSLIALDGSIIKTAYEDSNLIYCENYAVEQNSDEIYNSCLRTIKQVVTDSGISYNEILSIGIDGQMAGIVGIDENWNAITPYDSWLDNRCDKYKQWIKSIDEKRLILISGSPAMIDHAPKILWWKNEKPDTYKKISKFLMIGSFIAGKLCALRAEEAFIDYTYLHFTGLADIVNCKWSDELCETFGISKTKMPQIVEPWKIIGKISKETADKCGLLQGTPVIAGCGDTAAASLGAGIVKAGMAFDVAGTASVFSCCVDRYSPDLDNKTLIFPKSVIPGLWNPMAYIGGGGLCLKWFRDEFFGGSQSYKELDERAQKIPAGSENLIFIPHFNGRVLPDSPYMRGSFMGLNWVHTRYHMYRSIMEGIAYEYHYYLNIINSLVGNIACTSVLAVGGGAGSEVFNSIKSDILGIPYYTQSRSDTATFGMAILAGYGVGIYDDLIKTITGFVQHKAKVEPSSENRVKYLKQEKSYEDALKAMDWYYGRSNG